MNELHHEGRGKPGRKISGCIALMIAIFSVVPQGARADLLDVQFAYTDPNGQVTGEATLTGASVLNDPGVYLVTAGTLQLSAPLADGISGSYQLFPNPGGTSATTSPTGLFIFDNLNLTAANPIVTNPGLLFYGGTASGSVPEGAGSELNFFSSGTNTYSVYTGVNGYYPYSYTFTAPQGTSTTKAAYEKSIVGSAVGTGSVYSQALVSAPEPATWVIMIGFLLLTLRRKGGKASRC